MLCLQLFREFFWHPGKVLPESFKSVLADLDRWDIGLRIHSRGSGPWAQIDGGPVRVCCPCFLRNSFHGLPSTLYNCPQTVFCIVEIICYDNEPIKFSTSEALCDF